MADSTATKEGNLNMADSTDAEEAKNRHMELLNEMQSLTMRAAGMSREELQAKIKEITEKLKAVSPPKKEPRVDDADLSKTQQQPLQGMRENRAGGFSYVVDNETKMKRYIVLGTETSSYMVTTARSSQAQENIKCVMELIKEGRGRLVIDTITKYALEARVAREENILMILRDCAMYRERAMYDNNRTIQRAAYDSVVKICNIPTKLFRFLELCETRLQRVWKAPEVKPLSKGKRKRKVPTEDSATEQETPSKKKKKKKSRSKGKAKKFNGNTNVKKSSAWGRMRRRGIGAFYTDEKKDANRLLLLLTKYKNRHTWSHMKTLGYAHPKIKEADDQKQAKDIVFTYVTRGYEKMQAYLKNNKIGEEGKMVEESTASVLQHIEVLNKIQKLDATKPEDEDILIKYLNDYGVRNDAAPFTTAPSLPNSLHTPPKNELKKKVAFQIVREHIPTGFLKKERIWAALLKDMPMTALIRNLGKMTSLGIFDQKENVTLAVDKLTDGAHLQGARIHPVKVLIAMKMYEQGHGDKGFENQKENQMPLTWSANQEILKALDQAFYLSFKAPHKDKEYKNKEHPFATGKKFMLALDVSGSMTWSGCYGCEQLTPAVASTALAMVTWNIEKNCRVMGFGGHLEDLEGRLRKDMTVNDAMKAAQGINFGRTDCALPMQHALQHNLDIDVFIIYTDSDTWSGRIHPSEALVDYRKKMNKPEAKLLVLAMQSTGFTIADPKDPFMMDICGFDADVPDIIYEFSKGTI